MGSEATEIITQDDRQALGLFDGISNKNYHAGGGISSTQLKDYIHAPRIYQAYRTGELVFQTTPAMILGTVVHRLVLEPDDLYNEVAVRQKVDGRTNAGKAYKAEFEADNEGKIIIDAEDFDTAQRVRDSILAHPEVKQIFASGGKAELSGYYMDENDEHEVGTFQLCRYRPDYRTDFAIVDVKTCQDASKEGFRYQIKDLGYHISAAHYIAGDRILKGTNHRNFIFIAAETKPPYLVAVYPLGERSLQLGEWHRRRALNGIKMSREHDYWPQYNDNLAIDIDLHNSNFYEMDMEQI